MKHKVKVVKLPTKGKSGLQLAPDGSLRFTANNTWESQHLYATVSQNREPIKPFDWCINLKTNHIFQASYMDANNINSTDPAYNKYNCCKKIIATTDPKLNISIWDDISTIMIDGKRREPDVKGIPQLQQSFLKEFVDNPSGEWEVGYRCQELQHYKHHLAGKTCTCKKNTIVINPDNTVNITSVEDKTYSREDVKVLINKTIDKWRYEKDTGTTIRNNWIKDNLK
tara:strand:+ start:1882 stop:2559 length:678 start_codon:yes stop_codon:yes gene_type:complete